MDDRDREPALSRNAPAFDPAPATAAIAASDRRRRARRATRVAVLGLGALAAVVLAALRVHGLRARDAARERPTAVATAGPIALARDVGDRRAASHSVLFVHGLGGTPADFRDWPERLVERTGWHARTLVLPGHGEGPDAFASAGAEDWRAALAQAWNELARESQRLDVVGFSLGAALALERAVETPPRRLVLVAPYLGDAADGPVPGLVRTATRALEPLVPWVDGGELPRGLSAERIGAPPRQRAWPLVTVLEAQRVAASARRPELLARIGVPVLMLHPRSDRIAAPRRARRAADELPHAQYVELARGDHVVAWDAAHETAFEALLAFLADDAPRASASSADDAPRASGAER